MERTQPVRVIVVLPYKRPTTAYEPTWTPEKDMKLWSLISSQPPYSIDWDYIASGLSVTPEMCVERSSELYKQRLQFIQRDRSIREKSRSTILSESTPQTLREESSLINSRLIPLPIIKVGDDDFRELVINNNFDWNALSRQLGANPQDLRNKYWQLDNIASSQSHLELESIRPRTPTLDLSGLHSQSPSSSHNSETSSDSISKSDLENAFLEQDQSEFADSSED